MSILLKNLNEEQKKAIQLIDGPVLVIAGAGSGKTRTLTHRIAYLIQEKKISPSNILAVTFTNKAANEMKKRIYDLLQSNNKQLPLIGTFHSICVHILRKEIGKFGYQSSFNIFDDQDQLSLIKKIFKELEIDKNQVNPRGVLSSISKAKNELLDRDYFERSAESYYEKIVAKIYKRYQEELKKNNALDFDDLIMLTVKIFQENNAVLEKYQNLFRYIMIDEYQDTNHAQYLLVNLIAKKHQNIFVVGDDFQSVYMWRGANIKNILSFEKDYPTAKIIKLEQNYRSTQIILDAANNIISNNVYQKKKKIWTEQKGGSLIKIYEAESEKDEAEFITNTIEKKIKNEGNKYSDFAVLYRTNAQSRVIEELFLKHSIPYRIVGGIKFYQRKEIKDVISYLRFIYDSNDFIALERIINTPKRGLGEKTLEKWVLFARENNLSFVDAGLILKNNGVKINAGKIKMIAEFCNFVKKMKKLTKKKNLSNFIREVFTQSGYEKSLEKLGEDGETRKENIQELLSVADKYRDGSADEFLQFFLEEIALAADADKINQEQNVAHLMTLHSAKGLEFPYVFIAGMEEGLLPHSRSLLSDSELEEERRLMYVGITRAEREAYLTYANMRIIFGSTQANPVSRFIDEIPKSLTEKIKKTNKILDESNFDKNYLKKKVIFSDGERVAHPDFGEGIVIATDNDIITVAFKNKGIKKISSKYTSLKKS